MGNIMNIITALLLLVIGIYVSYKLFDKLMSPWLIKKSTKQLEINPKWITEKLQNTYYGFGDLDIIIVDSPLGMTPRFELSKHSKNKIQLLISEDISTNDIEDIAQLALAGRLRIKYGVWYPDKPTYWLSILNYMLDGGDVREESTSWEKADKIK